MARRRDHALAVTSPRDVAQLHAEFDSHADDRVRLFRAIVDVVPPATRVLYPGSYVDIAPSIWFDDATYVDIDKRAARFFEQTDAVGELVRSKRAALDLPRRPAAITFHHLDYRTPIPQPVGSFDLVVSLYAGFISEHCTDYLKPGGTLLVNGSHGDAAMASIDPRYRLAGVVAAGSGGYRVSTTELDRYLIPKKDQIVTAETLHDSGRGIAYSRSPFAYLFTRVG